MDKKIEKGTVLVANETIAYAEGGIVSKEFVHANAGSLTLFAFDEGQGLSEHSAPFDATVQVIELLRSEERRVGKECRSRWSPYH